MSELIPQPSDGLPPNLSQPARRSLIQAGYVQLEQFTRVRASDLMGLHGLGPKTIRQLREVLAEHGWAFVGESDMPNS